MARRRSVSAWALSLAALAALCLAPRRTFVAPPLPQLDLTAPNAVPRSVPSPCGQRPALTLAFAFALVAGQLRRPVRTARKAEEEGKAAEEGKAEDEQEEDKGRSPLDVLAEADTEEEAAARSVEEELENGDFTYFTGDQVAGADVEEASEEELARRGERQITYKLYPARQYVLYIAQKNAERTWARDSAAGPGTNIGCIEVQIAVLTEKIRNQVLHCRECPHDYKCRLKLGSAVSRRRRMLDRLSWTDLDSYLKIREALKIRHVYRLEALIGRLPSQKYGVQDRKQAPGRKTANRLKKTKKLLARRLATQLRQGRPSYIIHKTKKQMNSRKWLSRAYDEAEWMVQGKTPQPTIDPLNVP